MALFAKHVVMSVLKEELCMQVYAQLSLNLTKGVLEMKHISQICVKSIFLK